MKTKTDKIRPKRCSKKLYECSLQDLFKAIESLNISIKENTPANAIKA